MDVDVFPNVVDYWGPNGMLFFRNVQVFWEPFAKEDDSNARIAIEAPGASGDAGVLADRVELQNVRAPLPVTRLHGLTIAPRASGATSRSAARSARSHGTTPCPTTSSI